MQNAESLGALYIYIYIYIYQDFTEQGKMFAQQMEKPRL